MIVTLYVKIHNVTGLMYFGKTIRKDVLKYKGSGKYWLRHIKIHGYDVTTEIIGTFDDINLCKDFAMKFSIDNDIVNSKKWANLILENGIDGGTPGYKMSDEQKKMISDFHKGRIFSESYRKKLSDANKGNTHSTETKIKISKAGKGRVQSYETKEKRRLKLIGQKRSEEFKQNVSKHKKGGILSEEHKSKLSSAHKGKILSQETKNKIKEYQKGRPKIKICRIFDRKEMAVNNFRAWENNQN